MAAVWCEGVIIKNMLKEKKEASFKEICSELGITDYDLDTNSPFVQVWNLEDFLKSLNLKNESDFDKFAEAAAAKHIMACATFDDALTNKRMLIIKLNKEHPIGQVISTFFSIRDNFGCLNIRKRR